MMRAESLLTSRRDLEPGLIFEIAKAHGVSVPHDGDKRPIRCPLHDDKSPSAFLSVRNVFFCSVCTPELGLGAIAFRQALQTGGVPMPRSRSAPTPVESSSVWRDASRVWQYAFTRSRNDDTVEEDEECYAYLRHRRLIESWEYGVFGILASDPRLPSSVAWWPDAGYRIVAPLFDADGNIANIQARSIRRSTRKTVFPAGSTARGFVFADSRGLQLLRGEWTGRPHVILAEGLTDFLALSTLTEIPVLSVPGTAMAASSAGTWARGMNVLLAFDQDPAGDNATHVAARRVHECGASNVHRIVWPRGAVDACDALAQVGADALMHFVGRLIS